MHRPIKYLRDEQGHATSVVVSVEMWESLTKTDPKLLKTRMTKKMLRKYIGKLNLTVDPRRFQKALRREW